MPFPGAIVAFAGNNVPPGWLPCEGQMLDRTVPQNAPLFNVIGTIHGGDGANGFQLPDYRGMFLRGVDAGSGRDPDAARRSAPGTGANHGNTGDRVGSIQLDAVASHRHEFSSRHLEAAGGTGFDGAGFDSNSSPSGAWEHNWNSTSAGGAETRPKNAGVRFLIKL